MIATKSAVTENYSEVTTVDSADVTLHTNLMKLWWDPNSTLAALRSLNLLRVPFIRDGLLENSNNKELRLRGKKILDVGCGGGILTEALAELGADVTGIDASKELIELAQEHSARNVELENKPTYCFSLVEEHAQSNESVYDAVVASEIIEHVTNKELFVQSCVRALKPGGRIFFTTPSRTRLAQIVIIFVLENIVGRIAKGTHQIEKFVTPNELAKMLEDNGCQVEITRGFAHWVFIEKWLWVHTTSFMFAMQAVKRSKN